MNTPPVSIIAFATDFGTVDPCIGVCEGVMLGIAPNAKVVHLNHNVTPQSVNEAIFNFFISYKYFADNTVFCFVIDPGVGSERRAVAVKYQTEDGKTQYLVAPDNGIFTPLLNHETILEVIDLDNSDYHLPNTSTTFHGRDIFSPAAAHIAAGTDIRKLGTSLDKEQLIKLVLPMPALENGVWHTEIIHIDRFGNLVTNILSRNLEAPLNQWTAETKGQVLSQIHKNFASVDLGESVAYTGSSGFIEIGVRNGNASATLNLQRSDEVFFRKVDQ